MSDSIIQIPQLARYCNEALILSMIDRGISHGYQLALEIEEHSHGFFKFNHGTLYPILHKLELDGLVTGNWHDEGPKRRRKYYELTDKGRDYLKNILREWQYFYEQFFAITEDHGK
ncbi:MAG: PadR family transcriptional regulator [Candidatus Neomarinimicrobiota bacterium]